jgi:hypothetical protein
MRQVRGSWLPRQSIAAWSAVAGHRKILRDVRRFRELPIVWGNRPHEQVFQVMPDFVPRVTASGHSKIAGGFPRPDRASRPSLCIRSL